MKILYVHTFGGGVAEARLHMQARALQRRGHEVIMFPEWEHYFGGLRAVHDTKAMDVYNEHLAWADVVHTQYNSQLGQVESLILGRHRHNKPVVVDLDDDVFHVPPYNTSYRTYHAASNGRQVAALSVRIADSITVSTPTIRDLLLSDRESHPEKWAYRTDAPIHLLPNYDDPLTWADCTPDPASANDTSVRILFAGGLGRYGDLEVCKEAIEGVMRCYDGTDGKPVVRLFFIGCMPDWAAQWMPSRTDPALNRAYYVQGMLPPTYKATLAWLRPDIMLCPVTINEFNASKSCLKAYEAAHAGAAVLCTDYTTYDDIPNDCAIKVDNTTPQWRGALDALITDATLRRSLNTRLSKWVASRGIDQYITSWETAYTGVPKPVDGD